MTFFNIVAQTTDNTVVTEYEPVKARSDSYQSEADLEKEFIRMLTEQGYAYLPIHSEAELVSRLEDGFLDEGEFVYEDPEKGLWRYCSDTLWVEIRRISQEKPLRTWYEAEIRCAEGGEFPHMIPVDPEKMKRVFLIKSWVSAMIFSGLWQRDFRCSICCLFTEQRFRAWGILLFRWFPVLWSWRFVSVRRCCFRG